MTRMPLVDVRRGRPRKFSRPARTVTLTLPEDVIARLSAVEKQPSLTNRELDVLAQLCLGRSNRDIARALELTEKTAAFYVSNVLAKLSAKTRSEAVGVAHRRGLVSFPRRETGTGRGNDEGGA